MLPVVVDDDFDEGPPEERADQEDFDEAALPSADSSMTHAVADSALSASNLELERHQPSAEVLAPLTETVPLSEKDRRKAEKVQQKAEKEVAKAEKAKEAAAKLCCMCGEKAEAKWLTCSCSARSHVECLAKRFLKVCECAVTDCLFCTEHRKQRRPPFRRVQTSFGLQSGTFQLPCSV